MSDVASLAEVAAMVGLTPSRFRKVWARWVATLAFPGPFSFPPGAQYQWRRDGVLAWREGRERAFGTAVPAARDASPVHDAHRAAVRLAAQRQEARALMMEGEAA